MKSIEKYHLYKEALSKWARSVQSHIPDPGPEPKPEDYGMKNTQELYLAKRAKDEVGV